MVSLVIDDTEVVEYGGFLCVFILGGLRFLSLMGDPASMQNALMRIVENKCLPFIVTACVSAR